MLPPVATFLFAPPGRFIQKLSAVRSSEANPESQLSSVCSPPMLVAMERIFRRRGALTSFMPSAAQ